MRFLGCQSVRNERYGQISQSAFYGTSDLREKFRKIANINFQHENLYSAYLQGLLSKTDIDLTDLLIEKNEKGLNDKAFFKRNYKLFEKFIF